MAAKRTSDLIPLCHQLALTGVDVEFAIGTTEVTITATVRTTDRTGVEMEALTAVSVAALTVYEHDQGRRPGRPYRGPARGCAKRAARPGPGTPA